METATFANAQKLTGAILVATAPVEDPRALVQMEADHLLSSQYAHVESTGITPIVTECLNTFENDPAFFNSHKQSRLQELDADIQRLEARTDAIATVLLEERYKRRSHLHITFEAIDRVLR